MVTIAWVAFLGLLAFRLLTMLVSTAMNLWSGLAA